MAKRFERAIFALLHTRTIVDAAKESTIPLRTLSRWISEDEQFKAQYAKARAQMLRHALAILCRGSADCAEALIEVATKHGRPGDTAKVTAGTNVIKMVMDAD